VEIFGKDLEDSPELTRRACEAFNSSKSQYKFTYGNDKTRDADFAILDPNKVIKDITKGRQLKDVKSHTGKKYKAVFTENRDDKDQSKDSLEKAASAEAPIDPATYIELDTRPEMLGVTISNTLNHQRDMLLKLAYGIDDAETDIHKAQEDVERAAAHLDKIAAGRVVSIASAHYGKLFDGVREAFPTYLPLLKFAADPVVPNDPIFEKIANYTEKAYIRDNKKQLLKQAAADISGCLRKLASCYNLLRKNAGGIGATMLGSALGPSLREALNLDKGRKNEVYNKLLNTNVQNILRELETKRNFYEVYADDYISSFPVSDVQVAYNNAIQKLPESLRKHPSSATQLVRSWVIKMLSRGSVTSAEDASDVLDAARAMRFEGRDQNPYEDSGDK
jgi:flagellar biosynthesis chaperone FliJ